MPKLSIVICEHGSIEFWLASGEVYYTNSNGEGLWDGGKQILGNTQFNVRGVSRTTMRRRFIALNW
jgi:hypothetical protein